MTLKIASFFAGMGGLDTGVKNAGFDIVYANEYDKSIWATYEANHSVKLDRRSIMNIEPDDIPDVDGFIGGPPCQSWSCAGSGAGAKDKRGATFFKLLTIIKAKQPKFFVLENVAGILSKKHEESLNEIIETFQTLGYDLHFKTVNAADYGVPQDRKRVIFVGFKHELNVPFTWKNTMKEKVTLKDVLDPECKVVATTRNHMGSLDEYFDSSYSSRYMSRNRVRQWHQPSFTIPAMARQIPLHPSCPLMVKKEKDEFEFVEGAEYRRLSVHECLRIQTFPDDYVMLYSNIVDAYKMIGNAVPVRLAEYVARCVFEALNTKKESKTKSKKGTNK